MPLARLATDAVLDAAYAAFPCFAASVYHFTAVLRITASGLSHWFRCQLRKPFALRWLARLGGLDLHRKLLLIFDDGRDGQDQLYH